MTSVTEIQDAIRVLGSDDFARLRRWMSDLDWDRWDQQVEADSEAGSLDFLVDEAAASAAPRLTLGVGRQ